MEEKKESQRNADRRKDSRRKLVIHSRDLPFPERRKTNRRQIDRRLISEEEESEILSLIETGENSE